MVRKAKRQPSIADLVPDALNPFRQLRVMGRLVRRAVKKPGTAPGTVIHTGERKVEAVRVHAMRYGPAGVQEESCDGVLPVDSLKVPGPGEGVLWVNVDGLHDVALLEKLGTTMGIHPLVMEDVASVGQRPKLEEYEDHLFIVIHLLTAGGTPVRVTDEQVSFIVGPRSIFTFQEDIGDVFDSVRERIRTGKGRVRERGSDFLAYALIDAVVDSCFQILEQMGEAAEDIEMEVLAERPDQEAMRRVHELKRELLVLRRSIWPLREMMASLLRVESPLIEESTRVYLRDVHDHSYQLIETVEILRDIASGMRDLYLSSVSQRTNEVMKVLTVISSIFIPLTFIAGVYGMNFLNMPELVHPWGYPATLLVMLLVAVGLLWYFRRKRWI
jgi:magnesium transporter